MKEMTEEELRELWSTLTVEEKIEFLNNLQRDDKLENEYNKEGT